MKYLKQWLKWLIIIGNLILPFNFVMSEEKKDLISYTQFLDEVEGGRVKEIKIFCGKRIRGEYIDGSKFTTNIPYYDENLIEIARKNKVIIWAGEGPPEKETPMWMTMVLLMFFVVFFTAILGWIFYNKKFGFVKNQTLYWEKIPSYLNELIKKLDFLIELLKEKK